VPIVIKSGSLNLLEPSGPVKVCNGIALPFYSFLLEAESTTTVKLYFETNRKAVKYDYGFRIFQMGTTVMPKMESLTYERNH
jgi:hypothetical protein